MRNHSSFGLSTVALAAVLLLPPILASAQTPEPAAGNPAIINTPNPSSGDTVTVGFGRCGVAKHGLALERGEYPKRLQPR
jgi:hypothetical protein